MALASSILVLGTSVVAACKTSESSSTDAPAAEAAEQLTSLRRLTVHVQFVGTPGVAPVPGLQDPQPVSLGAASGATVQLVDRTSPGSPMQTVLADDRGNVAFMVAPRTWRVLVPTGGQGSTLAGATLQGSNTPDGTSVLAWADVTVPTESEADLTLSLVVALV
jgi:hypothetical protein